MQRYINANFHNITSIDILIREDASKSPIFHSIHMEFDRVGRFIVEWNIDISINAYEYE